MRHAALILAATALPATAQEIVPGDGMWTSTPTGGEISAACPEAIRPMLEPMMAMMGQSRTEEIVWGGTFDPQAIAEAEMQEGVTWTQASENVWEAEMVDPDLPGSDPAMTMRMEATATDRIAATMVLNVGAMMGEDATDMEGNPVDATGCTLTLEVVSTLDG